MKLRDAGVVYRNIRGYELGPVYGPVDQNFLPVVGLPHYYEGYSTEPVSDDPKDIDPWQKVTVFADGFVTLNYIKLIDGDFELNGYLYDPPLPALWTPNDFNVVIRLVFEEEPEKWLPYVAYLDHPTDFRKINGKWSSPLWFAETDFGRTYFCVHYWAEVMAKYPERIPLPYKHIADPKAYEMAHDFVRELKRLKALNPLKHRDKFYLSVDEHRQFENTGKDKKGFDTCTMSFFGADLTVKVSRKYDTEKGVEFFDDEEASENYTKLFMQYAIPLLPVFQRFNMLMAMLHGTYGIKSHGLRPCDEFFEWHKRK